MNEVSVGGRKVFYRDRGAGEAVVLLHAGFVADSMAPLLGRPELAAYRLIAPHRRGYGQSELGRPPVSLHDLATDVLSLLDATWTTGEIWGIGR